MPRSPEQEARAKIDAQLADCGWFVQDAKKADFSSGRGLLDELNEALPA